MEKKTELGLTVAFYISKFDKLAYARLPFGGVTATHKEVGAKLGIKSTSVQNMRDEFDPINENPRKGWHQRRLTPTRQEIVDRYAAYSEPRFRHLVFDILELPVHMDEWSTNEIRTAVNTYFYLLLLQQMGALSDLDSLVDYVSDEILRGRDNYSIYSCFRYISRVLRANRLPTLDSLPPIRNPKRNILAAISAQVAERSSEYLAVLHNLQQTADHRPTIQTVQTGIDVLAKHLETLEAAARLQRNHNHPPEAIEDDTPPLAEAQALLVSVKNNLEKLPQTRSSLAVDVQMLTKLGMKLAVWIGDRVTDFGKAAAVAGGTAAGVWATGLGPQLFQTIKAIGQIIGL
ncbi:hypothetical protein [Ensifer adhaerens]|jgi:hypothetical protein|uniref:hypothetical protein n=1 Tax=Ensifer adhaerens TaxID=106592 RepID=UPI00202F6234|nr:hypothetical protein [Ensifer adhaerens]